MKTIYHKTAGGGSTLYTLDHYMRIEPCVAELSHAVRMVPADSQHSHDTVLFDSVEDQQAFMSAVIATLKPTNVFHHGPVEPVGDVRRRPKTVVKGGAQRKAPWADFNGAHLFEGDMIRHVNGETGVIVCDPDDEDVTSAWRVDYGDHRTPSRLCLQVGDKGRAIKVTDENPQLAAYAQKAPFKDVHLNVLFDGDTIMTAKGITGKVRATYTRNDGTRPIGWFIEHSEPDMTTTPAFWFGKMHHATKVN